MKWESENGSEPADTTQSTHESMPAWITAFESTICLKHIVVQPEAFHWGNADVGGLVFPCRVQYFPTIPSYYFGDFCFKKHFQNLAHDFDEVDDCIVRVAVPVDGREQLMFWSWLSSVVQVGGSHFSWHDGGAANPSTTGSYQFCQGSRRCSAVAEDCCSLVLRQFRHLSKWLIMVNHGSLYDS